MFHIRQSFNTDALTSTLKTLFWRPSLGVAHINVKNVNSIDFDQLYSAGFRGVVFDKDNTLTEPYKNYIYPPIYDQVQKSQRVFGNQKVAILSNSAGSADDTEYRHANQLRRDLGISVIHHQRKKPSCINEVLEYFNTIMNPSNENPIEKHEIIIIGDRLLTDIVFGNIHGMLTIAVDAITEEGDNKFALWMRRLERKVLEPIWRKCGVHAPFNLLSENYSNEQ
eukprot:gb/GECH01014677.1/.p1 GENE.gb/GECH01014677.1/~~gb/GECH01014677.1/.p1  ORF type:complete len:224 (+),score=57.54 gb/GECH01014677.1/:1-672(+)